MLNDKPSKSQPGMDPNFPPGNIAADDAPTPPTPAGTHTLACAVAEHERTPGSSAKCACWCHAMPAGEEAQFCDDCEITHPCEFHVRPPAPPEADGGIGSVCAGCERTLRERLRQLHTEILPLIMGSYDYRDGYRDGLAWLLADKPASPSPADGAEGLRRNACDKCKRSYPHEMVGVETHDGAFVGMWCIICHDQKVLGDLRSKLTAAESALADALLVIEALLSRLHGEPETWMTPEAIAAFKRLSARRRA